MSNEVTEFTDAHLSGRFAEEVLKGAYLWASGLGWLRWTGTHWERTHVSDPREQARQWVLRHYREATLILANALASGDTAGVGQAHTAVEEWDKYTNIARLSALVSLAQGIVRRDQRDFDADPFVLNCQNGIVDLRTGDLAEHDPGKLITKVASVAYQPGAEHADWSAALEAVPADVRGWYQLRLGQGITGEMTPDDLLIVQQGGGANGKSTIMSAVQATVGDYFLVVSQRALSSSPDTVPTELADFKGVRLASLEELPEEKYLSVTRLKTMVGTPVITARFMRQDTMTFEATHTLVISTNYPPAVTETDAGTWRRLALVHFPYHYVKSVSDIHTENDRLGDPMIRERLRRNDAQREAVLAWLVAGAVKYYASYESFATVPDRVVADTLEWRKNSDLVLGYINDRIDFDADSDVLATELLEDFNDWLRIQNQRAWSAKTFVSRFGGHEEISSRGVKQLVSKNRDRLSRRPWGWSSAPVTASSFRVWRGIAFTQPSAERAAELRQYQDEVRQIQDWNSDALDRHNRR